MADEWTSDDAGLRRELGAVLRAHVAYQAGGDSEAPALVFADADYEVGDGNCGLHEDGKSANEPAIVYVRADAYLETLRATRLLDWMTHHSLPLQLWREGDGLWIVVDGSQRVVMGSGETALDALSEAQRTEGK